MKYSTSLESMNKHPLLLEIWLSAGRVLPVLPAPRVHLAQPVTRARKAPACAVLPVKVAVPELQVYKV